MTKTKVWIAAMVGVVSSVQLAQAADRVSALAVARDGKSVVIAGADKSVRVSALPGGRVLQRITLTEIPAAVALSPSGKTLAIGGFGFLDLYDPAPTLPTASASSSATTPAPHLVDVAGGAKVALPATPQ